MVAGRDDDRLREQPRGLLGHLRDERGRNGHATSDVVGRERPASGVVLGRQAARLRPLGRRRAAVRHGCRRWRATTAHRRDRGGGRPCLVARRVDDRLLTPRAGHGRTRDLARRRGRVESASADEARRGGDRPRLGAGRRDHRVRGEVGRHAVRHLHRRARRGSPKRVVSAPDDAFEPAYAPDGERLAYFSGGAIFVHDTTGEDTALTDPDDNDSSPAWNPTSAGGEEADR